MKKLLFLLALLVAPLSQAQVAAVPWYGGLHPVAVNWGFRILKNGGTFPRGTNLVATSNFLEKIDPFLNQIYALNPFLPESLTASLTPLVVGPGNDPWINHNFVAGDLTVNGLQGNASNKYLDTGLTWANTVAVGGSNHFGCETGVRTQNTQAFTAGTYDGANGDSVLFINFHNPGPSFQHDYWNADGSTAQPVNSQTYYGIVLGERYDLTHQTNYNLCANNLSVYSFFATGKNTTALNERQTSLPIFVFCANGGGGVAGTPGGFVDALLNWFGCSQGLNSVWAERYATNALNLRTIYGGAWN